MKHKRVYHLSPISIGYLVHTLCHLSPTSIGYLVHTFNVDLSGYLVHTFNVDLSETQAKRHNYVLSL